MADKIWIGDVKTRLRISQTSLNYNFRKLRIKPSYAWSKDAKAERAYLTENQVRRIEGELARVHWKRAMS